MKVTESIAQRRYNGVIDILKIFIETSHKRMMLNIAAGPRKNIALWDKKDGRMNWTGIDLDLVMGAVVRGLYFAFDDLNTTNK